MNWNGKKVLVTGAGGFIGSHLTERLVELGCNTRVLVRYNSAGAWGMLDSSVVKEDIEVILGDVRDRDSVVKASKGVDVVFNLAALIAIPYSYHAPLSYVQTNIEGALNILQAGRDNEVGRIVQTSTSEVYGTARYVPIDENHPLQGQSPYAATKIGADKLAESFYLSFGLPVAIIRPFNTYGPRQSARAVIPTIITQAQTKSEIKLGSLEPTRDFNYVADTVDGFIKMAECEEAVGQVINVGSGKEISIGELAQTILSLVGKEDTPIICENQRLRPKGSEVERLCAANSKAQKLLNWQPQNTLEEGLTKTIAWMEKNLERYKPNKYAI